MSYVQIAQPMYFSFQLDSVRMVEIHTVGPFEQEEEALLFEWLELVKRSIERASRLRVEAAHEAGKLEGEV